MTRDEIREIVMDCLKDYGVAKAVTRKKAPEPSFDPLVGSALAALAKVWSDCIGPPSFGRFFKAMKPLLPLYELAWIEAGLRAYATELHRGNQIRYASPEAFAQRASGYILPELPFNALTEAEAKMLGQDAMTGRAHAAALGVLTDRARGS